MRLTNYKRWIVFGVLISFLWSTGCATLFESSSSSIPTRPKTEAYTIELEPESNDPYITAPLKKGEVAPDDGIWLDKETAKRFLEMKAKYDGLRSEVGVQNKIAEARAKQLDLLYEANDYQTKANEELRKELDRKKFWDTVKTYGSLVLGIAAFAVGVWAKK